MVVSGVLGYLQYGVLPLPWASARRDRSCTACWHSLTLVHVAYLSTKTRTTDRSLISNHHLRPRLKRVNGENANMLMSFISHVLRYVLA